MFFHYSQNNSGGIFDFDKGKGITSQVIIEAESYQEANRTMVDLIGDWEGGDGGYCPCCGERWSEALDDKEGTQEPELYGQDIDDYNDLFFPKGEAVAIHFRSGAVSWR